jgi:hypothetical protein
MGKTTTFFRLLKDKGSALKEKIEAYRSGVGEGESIFEEEPEKDLTDYLFS